MLATKTEEVVVEGNLAGQKVAMSFDENSIAHLMQVLIDLYSDPEQAVLREYSTNALDSHVAAGQTRPIEVTLPTRFDPYLKIRDFGLGLSVEEITDIYSKYGASTKRGTNDQVGMLGLGCKSGLTYTPQFTMISIKNGVKVNVSISRNDDGGGMMNILDTVTTDEHDGVEIVIPAKTYNNFAQKASQLFMFWEPGTVLVDGEEPRRLSGVKLTDDITIGAINNDYVVMGNVAYPVNDHNYRAGVHYVARVPIGSINFTPSREQLHYTKLTKETLSGIVSKVKSSIKQKVQDEINASKTPAEAYNVYKTWYNHAGSAIGSVTSYVYKGQNLPDRFSSITYRQYSCGDRGYAYRYNSYYITIDKAFISTVVVGCDLDADLTRTQKAKLRGYANQHGLKSNFILTDKRFGDPWLSNFVDWADIVTFKLPRPTYTPSIRPKEKYQIVAANGYRKNVDQFDATKTVLYYSDSDFTHINNGNVYDVQRLLAAIFHDSTIVRIGKNRQAKFVRDFPKSVHLSKAIDERREDITKRCSRQEHLYLWQKGLDYRISQLLNDGFRAKDFSDPRFAELYEIINARKTTLTLEAETFNNLCIKLGLKKAELTAPDFTSTVLEDYPLLTIQTYGLTSMQKRDMVKYVNAKYKGAI